MLARWVDGKFLLRSPLGAGNEVPRSFEMVRGLGTCYPDAGGTNPALQVAVGMAAMRVTVQLRRRGLASASGGAPMLPVMSILVFHVKHGPPNLRRAARCHSGMVRHRTTWWLFRT